jgi:hypothetical protein
MRVPLTLLLAATLLGLAGSGAPGAGRAQEGEGSSGRRRGGPITDALGELHWGMRKQELLGVFEAKIEEGFREELAQVRGIVEEDRLLQEIEAQKRRLRDGWLSFEGQRTGWDVSFIGPEYTHGNQEAMLRIHEPGAQVQDFYFFIRGRFWKWYRAFDKEAFGGLSFDEMGYGLERRYGDANHRFAPEPESDGFISWLEWSDGTSRLRAVDESRFYSFYCLVYESVRVADRIEQLRTNTIRRGRRRHRGVVDSVTNRNQDRFGANADIVDRLTGDRSGTRLFMPEDPPDDAAPADDRDERPSGP